MGTQGAAMIADRFERLGVLYRLGLRVLGLAYTGATLHADGCGERRDAGLTFLGQDLIAAANELPLLLDLSHVGHRSRAEAAALSRAPVCTHSNAYAVAANDRNTRDEVATAIARKGGFLGICGLPKSVRAEDAKLDHLLDHADHYVRIVDAGHVAIGLDFTEGIKAGGVIPAVSRLWRTRRPDIFGTVEEYFTVDYPAGLTTIEDLPNLTAGLFRRGYAENDVAAILGGNWLTAFRMHVG